MEMDLFGVNFLAKIDCSFYSCELTLGSNVSSLSTLLVEPRGHTFSQRKGFILTTIWYLNRTKYGLLEVSKHDPLLYRCTTLGISTLVKLFSKLLLLMDRGMAFQFHLLLKALDMTQQSGQPTTTTDTLHETVSYRLKAAGWTPFPY